LQPFGLALADSLHSKAMHVQPVLYGSARAEVAAMTDLGGDASEGDEDLPLQPVFGRPKSRFVKMAPAAMAAVRQYADLLHGTSQRKSHDGVAGFMVSGRFVVLAIHFPRLSPGRMLRHSPITGKSQSIQPASANWLRSSCCNQRCIAS